MQAVNYFTNRRSGLNWYRQFDLINANSTLFCLEDGSPLGQAGNMLLNRSPQHLDVPATLRVWEVTVTQHHMKWEEMLQLWLERIKVFLSLLLMMSSGV